MKTILIADDEKIERKGIISLIERENFEVEILEAKNGKDAYELIKKKKPDILFTDIKMPFMSGIELINKTRELSDKIAIILFSGYSDFEYAREAIKNGALDYILKPIDPDEFEKVLKKALDWVDEHEQKTMIFRKNQDFLGEYFLQKYLHMGKMDIVREAEEILDISWWHNVRRLVLIETEDNFFEEVKENFQELLEGELKLPFYYLNLDEHRSMLLFDERVKADFPVMGKHIYEYMAERLQAECYVAVSSPIAEGLQMPEAFREVELLMENRFYRHENRVFLPDMALEGKNNQEIIAELLEKMEEDIRLQDISHLWEHFRKFAAQGKAVGQISHIYIKFSCFGIIKELYKSMHLSQNKCNRTVDAVYQCTSMQELTNILEENIQAYEEKVFSNQSNARSDVEKVKSYIYEHYAEELSVEILGAGVFLSPGYMSHIFKKETGEGLSRFIRVYRLEKAKELLQNTNKKIVQICRETGFTNSSYFCKSFREYYGCSPEKFRREGGGKSRNRKRRNRSIKGRKKNRLVMAWGVSKTARCSNIRRCSASGFFCFWEK